MSEVEKLYKNAGIDYEERYNNCTLNKEGECELECSCDICKYSEEKYVYPLFTAEKQIAILMFILNKFGDIGFQKMYSIRGNDESTRKDFIKCLCDCEHETFDSRPVDFYYQNGASGDNLEESLAGLINNLWLSLTSEEKQQVKGILE